MRTPSLCLALVVLAAARALVPEPAGAQVPVGGERHVNLHTAGFQIGADVAVAGNGDFVVVWLDVAQWDPKPRLRARRFAADGRAKGKDIEVDHLRRRSSSAPGVASDASGRFTVVWSEARGGRGAVLFARRYDAHGRPLGERFPVQESRHAQFDPDVAMTADGRAVFVWSEDHFDPQGLEVVDIHFRRMAANGALTGPAVLSHVGDHPRVALRADGTFAIASQVASEETLYDVDLSLYSAAGAPSRETFQVNAGPTVNGVQVEPDLAIAPDGRIFVAWTDRSADEGEPDATPDDAPGIAGQLLEADGTPIGDNVRINQFKLGIQETPSIAAIPSGGFLVAWSSGASQDGDGFGIFERPLAADGQPLGTETRVNLAATGDQQAPAVALAPNGRGALAWIGRDEDETGILARRLAPPTP